MLLFALAAGISIPSAVLSQTPRGNTFENIELILPDGKRVSETDVRVEFGADSMSIIARSNSAILKQFRYADISAAEYSYTKNPRWKTGLGLGAASFIFPPLSLIAIPVGFTKHRRHWVTIRTGEDFAVLKIGKGVRKVFIPTFETRSAVKISALGDDK